MSTYRLIYFNAMGRAEIIRFIFAQAGVKYEDVRLEREEWAKLKPTTPTGQLPILEVDGKQLSGTGPIVRFLAKRFDLTGSSDIEIAEIEGIDDLLVDFMTKFAKLYGEKDETKKAELLKQIQENETPKYWGVIEKRLQSTTGNWIHGSKPTYVDLSIYTALFYIVKAFPDFLEKHPGVAKLKAAVEALPKIAEWLKNRPKTEY